MLAGEQWTSVGNDGFGREMEAWHDRIFGHLRNSRALTCSLFSWPQLYSYDVVEDAEDVLGLRAGGTCVARLVMWNVARDRIEETHE